MFSSNHEDNGLLPKYAPSPEISQSQHPQHQQYSSGLNYGTVETTHTYPEPWKNHSEIQSQDEEDEEDTSSTIMNGIAAFFRFIFIVLFFVVFCAVFLSSILPHHGWSDPAPPGSSPSPLQPPSSTNKTIQERAKDILTSTPLIDGHNDLAIFIRSRYKNDISSRQFRSEFEDGPMPLNVDLPRLRAGIVGGAFWSAFVVCPINASYDMTDENYATAVSHTLEQVDLLKRLQEQYPKAFTSPTTVGSANSGRANMIAQWHATKSFFGPISIEGLHQVLPSAPLSMLRELYSLGVRMATLTWNCHNPFADAAVVMNSFTEAPKVVNGVSRVDEGAVTKRGREVIREMNRLGMIVDISHTSYWTQKAVLSGDKQGNRITRAPVVFSHSSAYSLCPHPRNVRDDILDLVPETKSLVMVNFSPDFISCKAAKEGTEEEEPYFALPEFYKQNNTLHQVARHIQYIGNRIGYAYVGIGSDFDGMGDEAPKGLSGVDRFPDLVAKLLEMGVSDKDVSAVVGDNMLRVWEEVDKVSAQMVEEGVSPGLDDGSGY